MTGTGEDFTPEEQAAMEAMREDTAPVTEEEQAAAPAAQPAPAAEPAAEPEAPAAPEGTVPHGAFHQERERRKQAEAEREELRQRIAAMEQAAAPKKPETPDMPDAIIDPEGFREWQMDRLKEQNERWQQQEQTVQQQRRLSQAAQLEQQFASATPDYTTAVQHLHQSRVAELTAYGYGPDQIPAILAQDANSIYDNAIAQGKNPAQVLYEAAKLRGYTGAPAAPVVDHAAQMEAKANAQRQTATLATAGGPSTAGEYTMETLSKMSEDQLTELKRKDPGVVRRIMGG